VPVRFGGVNHIYTVAYIYFTERKFIIRCSIHRYVDEAEDTGTREAGHRLCCKSTNCSMPGDSVMSTGFRNAMNDLNVACNWNSADQV